MSRIDDMLYPGEAVLWRTDPPWKSARNNLLWQIPALAIPSVGLSLLKDGFDADSLLMALVSLSIMAMTVFAVAYFQQGDGVIVTDRRVLRARGFFRPRRVELDRRHIAGAVVYGGDETLVLRAAGPDAIRLVEPDSAASLVPAGETEMRFAKASVDKDALLEALGIEPERIEPVTRPGTVANLFGARTVFAFVVAISLALGDWLVTTLAFPGLPGWAVWPSVLVMLIVGAVFGLWLAWPFARLTVALETARMFACFLYHPDWKAVSPENDDWRGDLRRAARRLSWLYGQPVSLDDVPRPRTGPSMQETEEPA